MQDWKSPSVNLSQISPDSQEVPVSFALETARSTFIENVNLKHGMEYESTIFYLISSLTDNLGSLWNSGVNMALAQNWNIFTTDLCGATTNERTTLIRSTKMFL